nr:Zinc finger CCCH domain containing protein 3 [Hymenolepis microstoma]
MLRLLYFISAIVELMVMSFRWRRTGTCAPPRYSSQRSFQNNIMRSSLLRSVALTSRFRYRRSFCGSSVPTTSTRTTIPNRSPSVLTDSSRGNGFGARSIHSKNRATYLFPSRKSTFKYHSKSWIANKTKLKSHSKLPSSKNPFVFHKFVQKNVITPVHPYRLSVKRAINMNRRFVRQICPDYVKTGSCESENTCPLLHNANYLRICPRFLQNICLLGEQRCPLAHVLDPCRIPQCVYFAKGTCSRSNCNFLHIKYHRGTLACQDFLIGRCDKGPSCKRRHIWRGDVDLNKNEKSNFTSQSRTEIENTAKECEHLGSLRNAKVVPDFIPFRISDD